MIIMKEYKYRYREKFEDSLDYYFKSFHLVYFTNIILLTFFLCLLMLLGLYTKSYWGMDLVNFTKVIEKQKVQFLTSFILFVPFLFLILHFLGRVFSLNRFVNLLSDKITFGNNVSKKFCKSIDYEDVKKVLITSNSIILQYDVQSFFLSKNDVRLSRLPLEELRDVLVFLESKIKNFEEITYQQSPKSIDKINYKDFLRNLKVL